MPMLEVRIPTDMKQEQVGNITVEMLQASRTCFPCITLRTCQDSKCLDA